MSRSSCGVTHGSTTKEVPPTSIPRIATHHVYHGGPTPGLSRSVSAPVRAGFRAVSAHRHRAPLARAVARAVVEGPAAAIPSAGLQPAPGPVRHRGRDNGDQAAQRRVDAKTNEITGFGPLLKEVDLADRVVTADALHTQTEHARWLVEERGADYLLTVKGNQPGLARAIDRLPQSAFSPRAPDR